MNSKEIEHLKRNSIYTLSISGDLKQQIITEKLNVFNKFVKNEIKRHDILIVITKID
jgi:hypothetical protein